jgi:hypothetical protein
LYSSKNPAPRAESTGNTTFIKDGNPTKVAPLSLAGLGLEYAFIFIGSFAFCRPIKTYL